MPYAEGKKVIQILEQKMSKIGVRKESAEKTCHVMACDLSHAMAGAPLRHHACRASSKAARAAPRA